MNKENKIVRKAKVNRMKLILNSQYDIKKVKDSILVRKYNNLTKIINGESNARIKLFKMAIMKHSLMLRLKLTEEELKEICIFLKNELEKEIDKRFWNILENPKGEIKEYHKD